MINVIHFIHVLLLPINQLVYQLQKCNAHGSYMVFMIIHIIVLIHNVMYIQFHLLFVMVMKLMDILVLWINFLNVKLVNK